MKKWAFLLIVIFSLFSSFVFAQDDPSILVGEYFLDADKSISVLGKTVGIGTVRSNGEVYVYINTYGKYIYPGKGFIEYEGLIVEPLETFYDSTDPKGHSASIAIYSTIIEEPSPKNSNEHFFNVGIDALDIDGKFVILERVGETGDVIVSVDSKQHTIHSNSQKIIKCLIIKNKETFYDSNRPDESTATLEITVANLCDDNISNFVPGENGVEVEKEAQELGSTKYFFEVNSKIELFDRKIKLLDVYEDGTTVVQVGEPTVIIFPKSNRQIYLSKGQLSGSFIDIRNEESFYSPEKKDRSASLDISLGNYIADVGPIDQKKFTEDKLEGQLRECNGCLDANDNCIPISVRVGDLYCDIDKNFKDQLGENALCNNNYECSSNLCIDNQCIEPGLFQKILSWFKRLFG